MDEPACNVDTMHKIQSEDQRTADDAPSATRLVLAVLRVRVGGCTVPT
jgi:hypothetical protein